MFTANTELQVSSLDFNSIKGNLKNFLKNKTEFQDYDFEGSTLNYLLELLAYNTYMNSFYTNMAINETYLDTAQIRSNVVSNAKKLGYTPKSAKAAEASVMVSFKPNDNVAQIKIPKKTKFLAKKDGKNFFFVTKEDFVVTKINNTYKKEIKIHEGQYFSQTFQYDPMVPFYVLLEKNVDISSLVVAVRPNSTSTDIEYFKEVDSIIDIDNTSAVYYLQENSEEKYEIFFGNGVLGKALTPGNVIEVEYFVTQGSLGNELASFTGVGYSGESLLDNTKKYIASSITTTNRSSFGVDKEGIDSIRFNAPNTYFSQNRLVTSSDFENYVLKNFPYIQSLNVWGGEEHTTPLYGKVVMSIKPFEGYSLPAVTKNEIISQMRSKNILAIDPLIVDPIFTFVKPTIRVTFDQTKTSKTAEELFETIRLAVQNYEKNELAAFNKSYRYSKFVQIIDSSDRSIVSNETEIDLEKRFAPIIGSTITYKINFDAALKHPYDGFLGTIRSTGFKSNKTNEILYIEDDGNGVIRTFYYEGGNQNKKRILEANTGTVDYNNGVVTLKAFYFTGLENNDIEMKVYATPLFRDYTQKKNHIILLSEPLITLFDMNTNEISKSGILDVEGNISPIISSYISGSTVDV